MADPTSLYEIASSAGTVVAAVAGGWAAWIARDSARAARATVEEAREARRLEVLPRFTLERNFYDLHFQWPTDMDENGWPKFRARAKTDLNQSIDPSFRLENFGQGPAIEVRVIFELVDHHGDLTIPPAYAAIGLSDAHPSMEGHRSIQLSPKFDGCGPSIPMYRRMRIDFPHLVVGQPRDVSIPDQMFTRIVARGLQNRGVPGGKAMTLIVKVEGFTSDGELVASQFRYRVDPFAYGPTLPQDVHAHVQDLHMFDRDPDTIPALG